MKRGFLCCIGIIILTMCLSANDNTQNITEEERSRIEQEVLHAFAQEIFTNAMKAKREFKEKKAREKKFKAKIKKLNKAKK